MSVQLLLDNHRRFLAFVEKRVGDRALAEDILQDAFVRSIDKAGEVPDEALVPWFYTTLRNAVVDRYRRGASQARALEAFGKERGYPRGRVFALADRSAPDDACAKRQPLRPSVEKGMDDERLRKPGPERPPARRPGQEPRPGRRLPSAPASRR